VTHEIAQGRIYRPGRQLVLVMLALLLAVGLLPALSFGEVPANPPDTAAVGSGSEAVTTEGALPGDSDAADQGADASGEFPGDPAGEQAEAEGAPPAADEPAANAPDAAGEQRADAQDAQDATAPDAGGSQGGGSEGGAAATDAAQPTAAGGDSALLRPFSIEPSLNASFGGVSLDGENNADEYKTTIANAFSQNEGLVADVVFTEGNFFAKKVEIEIAQGLALHSAPGMKAGSGGTWIFDSSKLLESEKHIIDGSWVPAEQDEYNDYQPLSGKLTYTIEATTASAKIENLRIQGDQPYLILADDHSFDNAIKVRALEAKAANTAPEQLFESVLEKYTVTGSVPINSNISGRLTTAAAADSEYTVKKIELYLHPLGASSGHFEPHFFNEIVFTVRAVKAAGLTKVVPQGRLANYPEYVSGVLDTISDPDWDSYTLTIKHGADTSNSSFDIIGKLDASAVPGEVYTITASVNWTDIHGNEKIGGGWYGNGIEGVRCADATPGATFTISELTNVNWIPREWADSPAAIAPLGALHIANHTINPISSARLKLEFDTTKVGVRALSVMAGPEGATDIVVITADAEGKPGQTLEAFNSAATAWPNINLQGVLAPDEYVKSIEYSTGTIDTGVQTDRAWEKDPTFMPVAAGSGSRAGNYFAWFGVFPTGAVEINTTTVTVLMPGDGVENPDYTDPDDWSTRDTQTITTGSRDAQGRTSYWYRMAQMTGSQDLIGGYTDGATISMTANLASASIPRRADVNGVSMGHNPLLAARGAVVYVREPSDKGLRIDPATISVTYGEEARVTNGIPAGDAALVTPLKVGGVRVWKIVLPKDIIGWSPEPFTTYPDVSVSVKVDALSTAPAGLVPYSEILAFCALDSEGKPGGTQWWSNVGTTTSDVYGLTSDSEEANANILLVPSSGYHFTVKRQAALVASAAADRKDGNWQTYNGSVPIDLGSTAEGARYRVTLANGTGAAIPKGFTVIIPIPDDQDVPYLNGITDNWEFSWPMKLDGAVTVDSNYQVAYDTSYDNLVLKDSPYWQPYGSIDPDQIRAIRITRTTPVSADFSDELTINLKTLMTDEDAAKYGGETNVFESLVYYEFNGYTGWRPSEPVGLRLNTGSIEGYVYTDLDRNGRYNYSDVDNNGINDPGEEGDKPAAGIVVKAYSTKDGTEKELLETTYTDPSGHYQFPSINKNWKVDVEFAVPGTESAPRRYIAWNSAWPTNSAKGDAQASNATWTVTDVSSGSGTVNALVQEPFTVSFDTDAGQPVPAKQYIYVDQKATAPNVVPEKSGYSFIGWYHADKMTPWDFDSDTILADTTIYAKFAPKTAAVTYYRNYPGDTTPTKVLDGDKTFIYGLPMSAPVYPQAPTGYRTDSNWYTSASLQNDTTRWDFSGTYALDADAPLALYAKWVPKKVAITYYYSNLAEYTTQNADSISASKITNADYNSTLATAPTPAPTRNGYNFAGWYDAPAGGRQWVFGTDSGATALTEANDVKNAATDDPALYLYAQWSTSGDTAYKVEHWLVGANGTAEKADTENLTGTTAATVSATKKNYPGYTYVASYDDDAGNAEVESGIIAGDGSLVLKLYYTINRHDVTYSLAGSVPGGAPSLPEALPSVPYGTSVSVAAPLQYPGFSFSGWSSSDVSWGETGSFTMPDRAVNIMGSWTAKTYTVFYDLDGGTAADGAASLVSRSVGWQDSALIPAQAPQRGNSQFLGWYTAGDIRVDADTPYSALVANDGVASVVLYAQWFLVPPGDDENEADDADDTESDDADDTESDDTGSDETGGTDADDADSDETGGTPAPTSDTPAPAPAPTPAPTPAALTPVAPSTTQIVPGSVEVSELLSAEEQGQVEAQTGNPLVDIPSGNVPTSAPGATGAWGIANLLISLIALLVAVVVGILTLRRPDRRKAVILLRVATCVLGVALPFFWLSQDHLNDPLVLLNSATPLVFAALAVQALLLAASLVIAHVLGGGATPGGGAASGDTAGSGDVASGGARLVG
jgi:uncharacterized repeat protein (TIGR02543 family)